MDPEDPDDEPSGRVATLAPTATTLSRASGHLSSDLDDSFLKQLAGSSGLSSGAELVPPRLGTVIDGKYRIESLCGRGGMGFVFGARHLASDRAVALKWMQRRGDVGELSKRFIGEARAAGRIRHPNVVDVYDVVATDDLTYLVMELLEGESLRRRLRNGCLSHAEAVELGVGVLSGLEEAHRRGVIHRDLKPENLFLCSGSTASVKIVDFGISVIANTDTPLGSQLTRAGQFVGTPSYTALERLRDNQPFDHRVDLYSVGVILYEALTGSLPFEAMSVSELTFQLATREPIPLRTYLASAPQGLVQVVQRALQREPNDRFQDARSFREALLASLRPETVPRRARLVTKAVLPAATLVVMAVAGVAWLQGAKPKPSGEPFPGTKDTTSSSPLAPAPPPVHTAVVLPVAAAPVSAASGEPRTIPRTPDRKRAPPPVKSISSAAPAPDTPQRMQPSNVTLRVVVFPYGDVWVDEKHIGSSPATLGVPPGQHRIAGGRSKPERERLVDVRPGETRDVVLSWSDKGAAAPSEGEGLLPRGVQLSERAAELQGAGVRPQ